MKRYEIIKGDVVETMPKFLEENPATVFALVYFDVDLYEPTKKTLECILSHIVKGSVIAFDEFGNKDYPGETLAFRDVFDIKSTGIRKSRFNPWASYFVKE